MAPRAPLLLAAALLAAALSPAAHAAPCATPGVKTYDGGDGNWNDASMWCDNTLPEPTDTVKLSCNGFGPCQITANIGVMIHKLEVTDPTVTLRVTSSLDVVEGPITIPTLVIDSGGVFHATEMVTVSTLFDFRYGSLQAPLRATGDVTFGDLRYSWYSSTINNGGSLTFANTGTNVHVNIEHLNPGNPCFMKVESGVTVTFTAGNMDRSIDCSMEIDGTLISDLSESRFLTFSGGNFDLRGKLVLPDGGRLRLTGYMSKFHPGSELAAGADSELYLQNSYMHISYPSATVSYPPSATPALAKLYLNGQRQMIGSRTLAYAALEVGGGSTSFEETAPLPNPLPSFYQNGGIVHLTNPTELVTITNFYQNGGNNYFYTPTLNITDSFYLSGGRFEVRHDAFINCPVAWHGGVLGGAVTSQMLRPSDYAQMRAAADLPYPADVESHEAVFSPRFYFTAANNLITYTTHYIEMCQVILSPHSTTLYDGGSFYIQLGGKLIVSADATFTAEMREQYIYNGYSGVHSDHSGILNFGTLEIRNISRVSRIYWRAYVINYGLFVQRGGFVDHAAPFHTYGQVDLKTGATIQFNSGQCYFECVVFYDSSTGTGGGVVKAARNNVEFRSGNINFGGFQLITGTLIFDAPVTASFDILEVSSGTLRYSHPESVITINRLRLRGGTFEFAAARVTTSILDMTGGSLVSTNQLNGTFVVLSDWQWNGGELVDVDVESSGQARICGSNTHTQTNSKLTIRGQAIWQDSGDWSLRESSQIIVDTGATLSLTRSFLSMSMSCPCKDKGLVVRGKLALVPAEATTGTVSLSVSVYVDDGHILITGGRITFSRTLFVRSGTVEIKSAGTLYATTDAFFMADSTVIGGGNIEAANSLRLFSRTVYVNTLSAISSSSIIHVADTIEEGAISRLVVTNGRLEYLAQSPDFGALTASVSNGMLMILAPMLMNAIRVDSGELRVGRRVDVDGTVEHNGGTIGGTGSITCRRYHMAQSVALNDIQLSTLDGTWEGQDGGSLSLSGGATLTIQEGGVVDWSSRDFSVNGGGMINNYGTINLNVAEEDIVTFSVRLLNFGTLNVLQGEIRLNDMFISEGAMNIDSNSIIVTYDIVQFTSSSSLSGTGTLKVLDDYCFVAAKNLELRNILVSGYYSRLSISSQSLGNIDSLLIQGGGFAEFAVSDASAGALLIKDLEIDGSNSRFSAVSDVEIGALSIISSGQFLVYSQATVNTGFNFTSGFIMGGGELVINTFASFSSPDTKYVRINRMLLARGGAVNGIGQIALQDGAELILPKGQTFNMDMEGGTLRIAFGSDGWFVNEGTLKWSETSCPWLRIYRLVNNGDIVLPCGRLDITTSLSMTDGNFHLLTADATLDLTTSKPIYFDGSIQGGGTLTLSSGIVNIPAGRTQNISTLEIEDGQMTIESVDDFPSLDNITITNGYLTMGGREAQPGLLDIAYMNIWRGQARMLVDVAVDLLILDESSTLYLWNAIDVRSFTFMGGRVFSEHRLGWMNVRETMDVRTPYGKELRSITCVLRNGALFSSADSIPFALTFGASIINFGGQIKITSGLSFSGSTDRCGSIFNVDGASMDFLPSGTSDDLSTPDYDITFVFNNASASVDGPEARFMVNSDFFGASSSFDIGSGSQFRLSINEYSTTVIDESSEITGCGELYLYGSGCCSSLRLSSIQTEKIQTKEIHSYDYYGYKRPMMAYPYWPGMDNVCPSGTVNIERGHFIFYSKTGMGATAAQFDFDHVKLGSATMWSVVPHTTIDILNTTNRDSSFQTIGQTAQIRQFEWNGGYLNGDSRPVYTVTGDTYMRGDTMYIDYDVTLKTMGNVVVDTTSTLNLYYGSVWHNYGTLNITSSMTMTDQSGTRDRGHLVNHVGASINVVGEMSDTFYQSLLILNLGDMSLYSSMALQEVLFNFGSFRTEAGATLIMRTGNLFIGEGSTIHVAEADFQLSSSSTDLDLETFPITQLVISSGTVTLQTTESRVCMDSIAVVNSNAVLVSALPISTRHLEVRSLGIVRVAADVAVNGMLVWNNGRREGTGKIYVNGELVSQDCREGVNLVANPKCDSTTSGWEEVPGGNVYCYSGYYGNGFFGGWSNSGTIRSFTQNVSIPDSGSSSHTSIDGGLAFATFGAWARAYTSSTDYKFGITVEFQAADGSKTGDMFSLSYDYHDPSWEYYEAKEVAVPAGTRQIAVTWQTTWRNYFDEVYVTVDDGTAPAESYDTIECPGSYGEQVLRHTFTPHNPCITHTDCGSCAAASGCGWSRDGGICTSGTASGPMFGEDCSWVFTAAECPATSCSGITDAEACVADVACNYCPSGCKPQRTNACDGDYTIRYVRSGSGNWHDPDSWSPARVPLATDTVLIQGPGTYTVIIDSADAVAASVTIGGEKGQQTLRVARTLTLTDNGVGTVVPSTATVYDARNSLSVRRNGQLVLTDNSPRLRFEGPIVVDGIMSWSRTSYLYGAGPLVLTQNARLEGYSYYMYFYDNKDLWVDGEMRFYSGARLYSQVAGSMFTFTPSSHLRCVSSSGHLNGAGSAKVQGQVTVESGQLYLYVSSDWEMSGPAEVQPSGQLYIGQSATVTSRIFVDKDAYLVAEGASSYTQTWEPSSYVYGPGTMQFGWGSSSTGQITNFNSAKLDIEYLRFATGRARINADTMIGPLKQIFVDGYNSDHDIFAGGAGNDVVNVDVLFVNYGTLRMARKSHVRARFDLNYYGNFQGDGMVTTEPTTFIRFRGGTMGGSGRVMNCSAPVLIEPNYQLYLREFQMVAWEGGWLDRGGYNYFYGSQGFELVNHGKLSFTGFELSFSYAGPSPPPVLTNNGELYVDSHRQLHVDAIVNNNGIIRVKTGRLNLWRGGTHGATSVMISGEDFADLAGSKTLNRPEIRFNGDHTFPAGSRLESSFQVYVGGGKFDFAGTLSTPKLHGYYSSCEVTIQSGAVVEKLDHLISEYNAMVIVKAPSASGSGRLVLENLDLENSGSVDMHVPMTVTVSTHMEGDVSSTSEVRLEGEFGWDYGRFNLGGSKLLLWADTLLSSGNSRYLRNVAVMQYADVRSFSTGTNIFETASSWNITAGRRYECTEQCSWSHSDRNHEGLFVDGRMDLVHGDSAWTNFNSFVFVGKSGEIAAQVGSLRFQFALTLDGKLTKTEDGYIDFSFNRYIPQGHQLRNGSVVSGPFVMRTYGDYYGRDFEVRIESDKVEVRLFQNRQSSYSFTRFARWVQLVVSEELYVDGQMTLPEAVEVPRMEVTGSAQLEVVEGGWLKTAMMRHLNGRIYGGGVVMTDTHVWESGYVDVTQFNTSTLEFRNGNSYVRYGCVYSVSSGGSWTASSTFYLQSNGWLLIEAGAEIQARANMYISGGVDERVVLDGKIVLDHVSGSSYISSALWMSATGLIEVQERPLQLYNATMLGKVVLRPDSGAELLFYSRESTMNGTVVNGKVTCTSSATVVAVAENMNVAELVVSSGYWTFISNGKKNVTTPARRVTVNGGEWKLRSVIRLPALALSSGRVRVEDKGQLFVVLTAEWNNGYIHGIGQFTGDVVVQGVMVMSSTSAKQLEGPALMVLKGVGTSWNQGPVYLNNGARLRVDGGATFDMSSSSSLVGNGVLENLGNVTIKPCGGSVTIQTQFDNFGRIISEGSLRLYGGSNAKGSPIIFSTDQAQLSVISGRYSLADFNDVVGAGSVHLGGSGTLAIGEGDCNVDFTMDNYQCALEVESKTEFGGRFDFVNGDIKGTGRVKIMAEGTWSAGYVRKPAVLEVAPSGDLEILGTDSKYVQGSMQVLGEVLHSEGNIYVQSRGKLVVSRGGVWRGDLQNAYGLYGDVNSGQVVVLGEMDINTINEEAKRFVIQGALNYGRITVHGWVQFSSVNKQFENAWLGGDGNVTMPSGNFVLDGEIEMDNGGWLILRGAQLSVPRVAAIRGEVDWQSGTIDAQNPDCVSSNPQGLPLSPCTLSTLFNEGLMLASCKSSSCYLQSGMRFVNVGTFRYTSGSYFYLYSDIENRGLLEFSNRDKGSTAYDMRRYDNSFVMNMPGGTVLMSSGSVGASGTRIGVPIQNNGGIVRFMADLSSLDEGEELVDTQYSYLDCLTNNAGAVWQDKMVEIDTGCSVSEVSVGNFTSGGVWRDSIDIGAGATLEVDGRFKVNGNVEIDGGRLRVDLFDMSGVSDRLSVGGSVTLVNGAKIAVGVGSKTFATVAGDVYNVLEWEGSLTGVVDVQRTGWGGGAVNVGASNVTVVF